jgi:hypothetical protein
MSRSSKCIIGPDAVGLRALGFGTRMIDVLDRKVEFVLVSFGIATMLAAMVG